MSIGTLCELPPKEYIIIAFDLGREKRRERPLVSEHYSDFCKANLTLFPIPRNNLSNKDVPLPGLIAA